MSMVQKYIMLVDDNTDDNFFHERAIKKENPENIVITMGSAQEALEYLKSMKAHKNPQPDMIFLDINMPGMNGWEFLQEYNQLEKELQCKAIVIMLTTSDNPDDIAKIETWNFVSDYITKPLTKETMKNVSQKFFN